MSYIVDKQSSNSTFVEQIWRGQTAEAGTFISVAVSNWEIVVWEEEGETHLALRGPESVATVAPVIANSASFGVSFALGTFMPHLPANKLLDQHIDLPKSSDNRFWFKGASWEIPTVENVDVFIDRLVREELLVTEPVVEHEIHGLPPDVSLRTAYRRFFKATGLTKGTVHQIERAREATKLLQSGMSILDTIESAGYYDQPHLTRSLKRYIGQTPAQLADETRIEPMSLG